VDVTPLQVLMSGATIANNGKLMQPTIVREVTNGEGKVQEVWFDPDPNGFSVWIPQSLVDDKGDVRHVWMNPANSKTLDQLPKGSYQISPFVQNMKWDVTQTPMIEGYSCEGGFCSLLENDLKTIKPETIAAVTEPGWGTLNTIFKDFPIAVAGKTGTAEYCDDVARAADQCKFGLWPTHAWTLAYAPYEDPEIIVVAFAYHGGEGASVAAPIVERVLRAYFELKSIDIQQGNSTEQ
jgi:penicillin-binding protein 2